MKAFTEKSGDEFKPTHDRAVAVVNRIIAKTKLDAAIAYSVTVSALKLATKNVEVDWEESAKEIADGVKEDLSD